MEKEIELEQEAIVVYSGGGAVNSVNGYTGDVVLTTSDLENTSDYQTGTEVESAISTAIAGKQDTLTAGNNITISNNTISATDTTYSAGTGLTLDGTQFSVNTETIATQQDVSNEATARENADTNLQGQIDAISASSDVTDIVGTYAALQAYDTTHLKDNDIIKVLQDESQNDETTYYRWSTSTQTFTLIGEEGPYYTKSQTDTLLNAKQSTLTAGPNVQIVNDTISATDTTYTAGTGLALNGTQFSVDTTAIATQSDLTAGLANKQDTLTAGTNIQINNNTISATDTTYSAFTGTDGQTAGTAGLVPAPATTDAGKFLKADGTWDIAGSGGSGATELTSADYDYHTSGSTDDGVALWRLNPGMYVASGPVKVYVQNSASYSKSDGEKIYFISNADNEGKSIVEFYNSKLSRYGVDSSGNLTAMAPYCQYTDIFASSNNKNSVRIGANSSSSASYGTAVGFTSDAQQKGSISLGAYSRASAAGEMNIGATNTSYGYNTSNYRLLTGLYDAQGDHDAVNLGQLNGRVLQNAGAPTTATVGTVGQLIEDTTNGKLYICTAIDTSVTPNTYTWEEVGAGGGGAEFIELTTADYNWNSSTGATGTPNCVALWLLPSGIYKGPASTSIEVRATRTQDYSMGAGFPSYAIVKEYEGTNNRAIVTYFDGSNSSIIEYYSIGEDGTGYSTKTFPNVVQTIGTSTTNVMSQKAVTNMIAPTTDSSAPTTATVGRLGQIQIDTTTATAYMCVAVDTVTPAYTWRKITS